MVLGTGPSSERGTFFDKSSKEVAKSMWTTVSAMASLAAKKTSSCLTMKNSSSKGKRQPSRQSNPQGRAVRRSPELEVALNEPKRVLNTISNKAITFLHKHVMNKKDDGEARDGDRRKWGDGGLWQRRILLGEKCQPLDFSGVIYYDNEGNQVDEVPTRSPRASPMYGYLSHRC